MIASTLSFPNLTQYTSQPTEILLLLSLSFVARYVLMVLEQFLHIGQDLRIGKETIVPIDHVHFNLNSQIYNALSFTNFEYMYMNGMSYWI